jgi:hypothetical protein
MWKDIQCLINVERYPIPHQCGKISNASSMWKDIQSLINVERYPKRSNAIIVFFAKSLFLDKSTNPCCYFRASL